MGQKATASVIANFRQVIKEGNLNLHPLIARLMDAETLEKMRASKLGTAPDQKAPAQVPEGETGN